MKKHIKKKYLFQVEEPVEKQFPDAKEIHLDSENILQTVKNHAVFVTTTSGNLIKAFTYNYKGKPAIIPIPDLTLVYFDMAYNLNISRKEREKSLFEKALIEQVYNEDLTNEIYCYYGHASMCIISLFTALESFINHIIPDDKVYSKNLNNKTEVYTKDQIQKSINFSEKIMEVLPFFYKKNFFQHKTLKNPHITSLKEIRDSIVHTKSEKAFKHQEELIKSVLKFKYDDVFDAVATFMNFYKKDFVVECDCPANY